MSLKKFCLAVLAICALGALVANSALAAEEYEESGSAWYTGASPGTRLPEGEANGKAFTTELASEKLSLETTLGGRATSVTFGLVDSTGAIFYDTHPTMWSGTLGFLLTKVGPTLSGFYSNVCSVPTVVSSKKLRGTVGMKKGSSTIATIKFVPESGTTIETIEISGAECPVAGLYKVTGALYGEVSNATGVFSKKQPIKFSQAIEESAGTATSLKFGENPAFMTGTININSENEFAVKKE